jgi:hypothetical protein
MTPARWLNPSWGRSSSARNEGRLPMDLRVRIDYLAFRLINDLAKIRSNVGLNACSCARGISLISLSSAERLSMNLSLPKKIGALSSSHGRFVMPSLTNSRYRFCATRRFRRPASPRLRRVHILRTSRPQATATPATSSTLATKMWAVPFSAPNSFDQRCYDRRSSKYRLQATLRINKSLRLSRSPRMC